MGKEFNAMLPSDDFLRTMIDQIPALAWSCRPDGSAEFVNQRWLDYTGLSMEEAVGWGWQATIHPEDLGKTMETWLRIVASEESGKDEARVRRFDGEYRWFLFRAVPVRDERGKVIRWYGTNTDIEDRKRTEEKLRQSEGYLSEAQRLSHTGSFGWRVSTGEMLWSEETFRIFQCEPTTKPTVELILRQTHPEDAVFVKQTIERASQDEKDFDFEHRLLMPDGSIKHVRVMGHAERGQSGELEFVGAVMDFTAAREAEQQVRRDERELRTTIETIPAFVSSILPDGSVDFVSQSWLEYLGCSREEILGWGWKKTIHPEDLDRVLNNWQAARAAGGPL